MKVLNSTPTCTVEESALIFCYFALSLQWQFMLAPTARTYSVAVVKNSEKVTTLEIVSSRKNSTSGGMRLTDERRSLYNYIL